VTDIKQGEPGRQQRYSEAGSAGGGIEGDEGSERVVKKNTYPNTYQHTHRSLVICTLSCVSSSSQPALSRSSSSRRALSASASCACSRLPRARARSISCACITGIQGFFLRRPGIRISKVDDDEGDSANKKDPPAPSPQRHAAVPPPSHI